MESVLKSLSLLLVLLNPFLVVVYLVDVLEKLPAAKFGRVLARAGLIAGAVFCAFAVLGDAIFTEVMQAEFASFQIFGGLVFLLIAFQFVFRGPRAIEILRGESEHIAGAIAMPILIGPGTISASVLVGQRHNPLAACLVVLCAVGISLLVMILLKLLHDYVRPRNEGLIQRYIEIAGRITALLVGTISIEMIVQGVHSWVSKFLGA